MLFRWVFAKPLFLIEKYAPAGTFIPAIAGRGVLGFEPGSPAREAGILGRTRLQGHYFFLLHPRLLKVFERVLLFGSLTGFLCLWARQGLVSSILRIFFVVWNFFLSTCPRIPCSFCMLCGL